jgi:hypothetical protein
VSLQLAPVRFGELAKRFVVPGARPRERGPTYRVARHGLLASACSNGETTG